jgi:hypothetical protein
LYRTLEISVLVLSTVQLACGRDTMMKMENDI